MVYYYRVLTLTAALILTYVATSLFFDYVASDDLDALDVLRVALLATAARMATRIRTLRMTPSCAF